VVRIAVESTESVLDAAVRAGRTVKSVVLVSSTAAIFDMPFETRHYTEVDWNTTSEHVVQCEGNNAGGFNAYLASKTAAEKVFWKFRNDHRPSFAMTALQPS
jgi:nucleoside-diphosphate-sugar epimerase